MLSFYQKKKGGIGKVKRINMGKVKEILKLNESEYSFRDIASSVDCGKSTVADIVKRAKTAGIVKAETYTEEELESILFSEITEQSNQDDELDMEYILTELSRKYVTRQLLWEEYKLQNPNGLMYSRFCDLIRDALKANEMDYHKPHNAGEECEVDWAGGTISYYDVLSCKWAEAFLFVAILPASNYPFVYAYQNQKTPNWIDGHLRAFEFFGGTPRVIIPDCTKTAVSTSDLFDPVITKTYQEMAKHYDITVIPARPKKPKDKNYVENAVGNVSRRIIAALRNEKFTSINEINTRIREKLTELINRSFKKMDGCRKSAFEKIDKPALRPLPQVRYELSDFASAKVGINYHVCYDKFFYSVPYESRGKECSIRATPKTIEIFIKGERICAHKRKYDGNRYITEPEHLPDQHKVVSEWNDDRFIRWAEKIGENTTKYIKALLARTEFSVQAYRSCMGVLRLTKDIPKEIAEAASMMALENGQYTSKYFELAIKRKRADTEKQEQEYFVNHTNIRGASAFAGGGNYAK
jgi:transposase